RGDTNLAVAPLFHIGGLNALTIRVLTRGGRSVIHRTFDPRRVLADIEKYGANQAFMVASMLSAMQQVEEFEKHDLTSMRSLICAGAPVPPVVIKQYQQKKMPVQQAWGLTETSPFATYLPTEFTYSRTGSCGIPMPYTEVKIRSEEHTSELHSPCPYSTRFRSKVRSYDCEISHLRGCTGSSCGDKTVPTEEDASTAGLGADRNFTLRDLFAERVYILPDWLLRNPDALH